MKSNRERRGEEGAKGEKAVGIKKIGGGNAPEFGVPSGWGWDGGVGKERDRVDQGERKGREIRNRVKRAFWRSCPRLNSL